MTATETRFASRTATTITRYVLVADPIKGETYRVTLDGKNGEETFTGRFRGEAKTGLRFVVDGKVVTRSPGRIIKIEAEETHEVPADADPQIRVTDAARNQLYPVPADAPTALLADEPVELDADDAPADDEFSPAIGGGVDIEAEAEAEVPAGLRLVEPWHGVPAPELDSDAVDASAAAAVEWNGRTLGQLTDDERTQVVAEAAAELNAELNHPAMVAALSADLAAEAPAESNEVTESAPAPAVPAAAVVAPVTPAEGAEGGAYDPDPEVDGVRLSTMRFAAVMELAKHYKTPGRGVARIGDLRDGVAKAIAAERAGK